MDHMARFGSIGKIVIKNSIGLQKNRKEIEYEQVQELDESASGCFSCKYYSLKKAFAMSPEHPSYKAACDACTLCPHKEYYTSYREKVTYVNDKNKYGDKNRYSSTLKSNALKLLLVLHLLHPNRYGIIMDASIEQVSLILGCDKKTVISNLDLLKKYNYIDYIRISRKGTFNVCILGYENYFLPAKMGGRGYMIFSDELVKELIKLKDITSLRLFLQELIDFDDHSGTEKISFTKSYRELKYFLPDYYKPNHIRKGLSKNADSPIFKVTISDSVTFQLNSTYNAKQVKEEVIQSGRIQYRRYFDHLNISFELINQRQMEPEQLLPMCYSKVGPGDYIPYSVSEETYEQLGLLSWQYTEFDIKDGIDYIYLNYVLYDKEIKNYCGLLRTIIDEQIENRINSSTSSHNVDLDESNLSSAAA